MATVGNTCSVLITKLINCFLIAYLDKINFCPHSLLCSLNSSVISSDQLESVLSMTIILLSWKAFYRLERHKSSKEQNRDTWASNCCLLLTLHAAKAGGHISGEPNFTNTSSRLYKGPLLTKYVKMTFLKAMLSVLITLLVTVKWNKWKLLPWRHIHLERTWVL